MKLHIGCGDIYLSGFCNVDIVGKIVTHKKLGTNLDHYYDGRVVGCPDEIFVDKIMDLKKPWDFDDNSIDEIVLIQVIEHFNPRDASFILSQIKRVLKSGGKLLIDFPDIVKTVQLYSVEDPDFMFRHIYCSQRNDHLIHYWGYTEKTFFSFLGEGWADITFKDIVKHNYPAIGCEAIKK